MEIELITKDEEDTRPAGKARDEPNMNPVLDPPKLVQKLSYIWINKLTLYSSSYRFKEVHVDLFMTWPFLTPTKVKTFC